eukprot:jgi/Chrzof1/3198/Cz12g15160.t1
MATVLGEPVPAPPTDGITRVRFSKGSNLVLASSWDSTARLYDASGPLRGTYAQPAPVLDACFQQDNSIIMGGLDCQVKQVELQTGQQHLLGQHAAPVKCTEWLDSSGVAVSASWDQTMKLWDTRLPSHQCNVATVPLPGKAYTMSTSGNKLVVGTSGRHVWIFDVKQLASGAVEQKRESSLKYQTRCIHCYPDGRGYALGSVEGRVAMEFFEQTPQEQANKYAFKCHRRNENGKDVVYPVNALAFHPTYGTFATGGGDGVINIWDGSNKKRLFQISQYPAAVASLSFSPDGSLLAVASSYMYEFGQQPHPADAIYIRRMQDVEVRPKPRAK